MAKMTNAQLKQLIGRAYETKKQGGSLSRVFDDFARQTGRAKGSIRNVYYSTLQKMQSSEEYMKEMLCGNKLEVAKIIGFEDGESDLLLRKILTGATFGKSVRRVISEMTDNPKLALRYQNKYRNLLKYEKQRVLKIRQEIIEDYGKCYEPYREATGEDKNIEKLKREIDALYDKIANGVKSENEKLKERVANLEKENARLLSLIKSAEENVVKDYFKSAITAKEGV